MTQEVGKLTTLKELDLSNNHLKTLPKEIGQLQNLSRLILRQNPISEEELTKIRACLGIKFGILDYFPKNH